MDKSRLDTQLNKLTEKIKSLPSEGLAGIQKVKACLALTITLEDAYVNLDANPYPTLVDCIDKQLAELEDFKLFRPHIDADSNAHKIISEQVAATKNLFEQAWTTYNPETYEHSVEIIRQRLANNKMDKDFFAGKRCFDGGCGTARFAIAMAELGAKEVVAADIGTKSIEFARKVVEDRKLDNVSLVECDVTELNNFETNSFDVVVSNGVLHHAEETERGIKEHFRITKPGGVMWLYLYGEGSTYWRVYDELKASVEDVSPEFFKDILLSFGVREGLVYTLLDNVKAPIRKYYSPSKVVEMLKKEGALNAATLEGGTVHDCNESILKTQWGADLVGPEAEVRLRIDKA